MKISSLRIEYYLFYISLFFGCNSQKQVLKSIPNGKYEIIKFNNMNNKAIIFGHVNILEPDSITHSVSTAIIILNNKNTLADKNGDFILRINPGSYKLIVGQIGMYKSEKIDIKVENGDSIQVNFVLRRDTRPLNYEIK